MTEQAKTIVTLSSVVSVARSIASAFNNMIGNSYDLTINTMVNSHGRAATAEMLASDSCLTHLHDNFRAAASETFTYDPNAKRFDVRIHSAVLVVDDDSIAALAEIVGRHLCRAVTVARRATPTEPAGVKCVAEFSRRGVDLRTADNKAQSKHGDGGVAVISIPVQCDDHLTFAARMRDPESWAGSVQRVVKKQFKKGNFDGIDGGKEAVRQFIDALDQWQDTENYDDDDHNYPSDVDLLTDSAITAVTEALSNLSDEALDLIDHYVLRADLEMLCGELTDKQQKKIRKFFKDSVDPVTRIPVGLLDLWLKFAGEDGDYCGIELMLGTQHQVRNRVAGFVAAADFGEWPDANGDFRAVLNK